MLVGGKEITMDSESSQNSGMSGKIEDLIVDLGAEKFMIRNDALSDLKKMLPEHEKAIATELVRWIQLYGKSDVGSSASFVNKAAMELFQIMTEMGLEPLINEGLADGDFYARRTVMDAIGRTGRMSVLPYLIKGMEDEDKYTRWQAAKGLGRYAGSNEAREALVKGLSDSDPHVRRRAGRSLENFGGVGPSDDKVEGPMEKDGKGDIDGDGVPDSEDKEPRVTEKKDIPKKKKSSKDKPKKKSSKEDDLARIAEKKDSIDFSTLGNAKKEDKDDLKSIKGIGPFLEEKLNALGIYTYEQISKMTPELEDQVNEAIEFFPGRIKRDEWVKQAKDLK